MDKTGWPIQRGSSSLLHSAALTVESLCLHVNVWDPHTPYRVPESFGDPFRNDPIPSWMTREVLARRINGFGPHSPMEPRGYDAEPSGYGRMPVPIDDLDKAKASFDGYYTGIKYADDHVAML